MPTSKKAAAEPAEEPRETEQPVPPRPPLSRDDREALRRKLREKFH